MKTKFYLNYCEDCTIKLKEFKSELELFRFTSEFMFKHRDNPDSFLEYAFEGTLLLGEVSDD